MIRKRDILLIAILAALAGILLLVLPALREKPSAEAALYLRYSIDGKPAATVPLSQETDLTVDQGNGMVNVLHLSPHGFSMASSSCHNQLCIYQGEVTAENMAERPLFHMIVCAPHRLVAELLTADQLEDGDHAK